MGRNGGKALSTKPGRELWHEDGALPLFALHPVRARSPAAPPPTATNALSVVLDWYGPRG